MKTETGQSIIKFNLQRMYHLPKAYEYIRFFIEEPDLRKTFFAVLNYIKDKQIIIYKHKYVFFLDNLRLSYQVRKSSGTGTSNRHINFLCAMGLLTKQYQNSTDSKLMIEINKIFLSNNADRSMPMNVFYIRKYTDEELRRINYRCKFLSEAGITRGNISYNQLVLNGLKEIADEVYIYNRKSAPDRKYQEARELVRVIDMLIDTNGYATKSQIKGNMVVSDAEIDRLFRIFKQQLKELFYYKRPTNYQKDIFQLKDNRWIFTRKENN